MSRRFSPLALSLALLLIAQLACNLPAGQATPDPFESLNGLYTASAQTLEAAGTATPGLPLPTETPQGTAPVTHTPVYQSPAPSSRCDAAQFLADVTYPDGSLVARNSTFVKIWRIKNIGSCAWTTSYALVFTGGDAMGASATIAMPGTVNPGQYIEIPVTMTSPNKDGSFRGYWKLRNASGVLFGIGAQADTAFWVDIKVGGPSFVAYSFAGEYCKAEWTNGENTLACPGSEGDAKGFVIRLNAPKMENGFTEDEPGLLTVPQDKRNGIISGQYPAFTIQAGDRFRTLINCQHNSPNCNVIFRLDYRSGGQVKTLASWQEIYEGKYYPVDLDLSSLAGQTVKFILYVSANGGNNQDNALWLNPHIIRLGSPPPTATPSQTPTLTLTPTATATATASPTETETPTETPPP